MALHFAKIYQEQFHLNFPNDASLCLLLSVTSFNLRKMFFISISTTVMGLDFLVVIFTRDNESSI